MSTFASDNYAGAHPQVVAAVAAANDGHAVAYGADRWSDQAEQLIQRELGEQAQAFFVFNGTGANVLALRAACSPWGAVICSQTAHLNMDETGAPERVGGVKLLTTPTPDGKLVPDDVERLTDRLGDEHQAQAQLVSIAQSTELGTVYTVEEVRALADAAHAKGLLLHMDGARLPMAAAALNVPLRAFTTDAGVDLLSFGATKVGALGAEAVVILDPDRGLADGMPYLRKQSLQLASKGRFLAAQFVALLEDRLWHQLASHANAMAARLADGVRDLPGVELTQAPQANAVFAKLPAEATRRLQERFRFYTWDFNTGEVRWMCAWDTQPAEVDAFVAAIRAEVGRLRA
ncbi:aminotransferase class I/II-fold pyridoxal phosphate-dependent enzyme [Conexibacter sp. JD483]|uniref:threonine aldolase family protein n=1 Tax=unclassified Conexibacter TaxID=2627773 RepID=UPI002720CF53|nr:MULTISPECIES: aminotransferase class I/II-fold pyridoxal phosphate-dependent enzyme [unclassified Conexibacter]MDO8183991.1 aminotransferase class I/II-fold pyridoxal phosphate-dependent enzyme [Conexibacter sp. CPCC 205706]MDO8196983.1 aminotransferase class I/II-fold pyridoxal phosphate-dependent enzyme [Conexibacter sp. CPCC 205762]MDR9369047.1 aminotransferase class I/II-fold pyridoxal phosphate-dependent enzyme [Conexibacter sp. JD483]